MLSGFDEDISFPNASQLADAKLFCIAWKKFHRERENLILFPKHLSSENNICFPLHIPVNNNNIDVYAPTHDAWHLECVEENR